ncbi:hypothetical protein GCM10007304_13410 [Rhodococcoides trifolii]|uniref:Uncharacterized protein n=1 Tax=Rhodococcoides trifolii TaxID=908250 RepID=A0A917CXS9_9NOCA|nr:hypothetical protein GCM10007304_13410 [Rhodococcus trifolii]
MAAVKLSPRFAYSVGVAFAIGGDTRPAKTTEIAVTMRLALRPTASTPPRKLLDYAGNFVCMSNDNSISFAGISLDCADSGVSDPAGHPFCLTTCVFGDD